MASQQQVAHDKPSQLPPQRQEQQPGLEAQMGPKPEVIRQNYKGSDKLTGKVAVITGGDSGIGRAVAVHFAREGADVAVMYFHNEDQDAKETKAMVEKEGKRCMLFKGDVADAQYVKQTIDAVVKEFGKLDILVNNAAIQYVKQDIREITDEQMKRVFEVNIFSQFYTVKAALDHMKSGGAIINNASINAFKGNSRLLDYTTTKGAIIAFTRSLALQLADKGIRVNAVAPGPVWTPLIPASMAEDYVEHFGSSVPMKRPGQPSEVAPSFVFLASEDASYFTGQTLHPNGGAVVNA